MKYLTLTLFTCGLISAQTASFPGSLVTDYQLKVSVNGVSTQLAQDIGVSDTSFLISSCDGIVPSVIITVDQEIMNVVACIGTNMIVDTRGFDSTFAASHASGAVIYAYVDAWHHNSLRVEVEAIESVLGVNLSNVLTPSTGVLSFNGRQGSVNLQSADVATVEQDLRTSASPSFVSLTLTGNFTANGTLNVAGNSSFGGTLIIASNTSVGGLFSVAGSVTGPHLQNLGTTDDVTFEDVTGRNAIFTGNMALSGTFSGTHAQNLGTGDSPTFNTVNATAVQSTAISGQGLTLTGTGAATCISQLSATFFILCNGNATFHNLSVGGTVSGSHLQNLGTTDSPVFAGLSVTAGASVAGGFTTDTLTASAAGNVRTINITGTGGTSATCVNVLSGITTLASILCNGTASFPTITATAVNGTTITGTNIISTNYQAGFFSGVSCSGTPTSSFVSTNGIVTHC